MGLQVVAEPQAASFRQNRETQRESTSHRRHIPKLSAVRVQSALLRQAPQDSQLNVRRERVE